MTGQNDPTLDRLTEGIRRFQQEIYPKDSESYRVAATTPQRRFPH